MELLRTAQARDYWLKLLGAAKKKYDSKMKKRTPHPDGPRWTTLAAGALNAIASADLSAAEGEAKEQIEFYNQMAVLTQTSTIPE